ncbi:hypothetical protein V1524DRAFT_450410 [Lipomyces starkeyi]
MESGQLLSKQKARPLQIVGEDGAILFPRRPDAVMRNITFGGLCLSFRLFVELLVSDRSEFAEEKVVSMEIYRDAAHQPDHMSAEARVFRPVDADQTREIPTRSDAGYNMIDDEEVIVLDSGARILCRDLADGQVVYSPLCETNVDKQAGRDGKWIIDSGIGTASATCIERATGQMVIYCFNCTYLAVVHLGDAKKINWQGREDISFDGDYRLFFLDAPMGTGKTHSVREYLRANPWLSVLSITFRQSLARYLSSELGLACYLDNGFWAPAARAQRSRCVVCLDSICKLQSEAEAYDLIITDECVFVKYHFLAGTITNFLPDVMRMFERLRTMRVGSGGRTLAAYLVSWYIRHLDRQTGRSTMPTVVFTTRALHAGLLLSLLRKVAAERFGEEAAGRINGIWAGVQDDDWIK